MVMAVVNFLVVVVILLAIPATLLVVRRTWLLRAAGSFPCLVQIDAVTPGARWVPGVGRFRGDEVWWYPLLGFGFGPQLRFPRNRTDALPSRVLDPVQQEAMPSGASVVLPLRREIGGGQAVWELAMAPGSVMALQSWLEAAPPGMGRGRRPASSS